LEEMSSSMIDAGLSRSPVNRLMYGG